MWFFSEMFYSTLSSFRAIACLITCLAQISHPIMILTVFIGFHVFGQSFFLFRNMFLFWFVSWGTDVIFFEQYNFDFYIRLANFFLSQLKIENFRIIHLDVSGIDYIDLRLMKKGTATFKRWQKINKMENCYESIWMLLHA